MRPYNIHFLAGLPRAGTTALAAVLNQHPQIHCSAGSALVNVMRDALRTYQNSAHTIAAPLEGFDQPQRMLVGLMEGFYAHVSRPNVIDKNRFWSDPFNMQMIHTATGRRPKVICPVRPVVDVLASWVLLLGNKLDQENVITAEMKRGLYPLTVDGLCDYLVGPRGTVGDAMRYMKAATDSSYADCVCIVHYRRFLASPQHELNKIHRFIGLDTFGYDFKNIEATVIEDDVKAYGIEGMHKVERTLPIHDIPARDILGNRLHSFYKEFVL